MTKRAAPMPTPAQARHPPPLTFEAMPAPSSVRDGAVYAGLVNWPRLQPCAGTRPLESARAISAREFV